MADDTDETDELLGEFLIESFENLDQIDQDLVALERDPESTEILSAIFRAFHTIKGTCGFLGYTTLGSVTHAAETLLALLRDGSLVYDADIATALMRTTDATREMLTVIETTHAEGPDDYQEVVAELQRLANPEAAADDADAPPADAPPAPPTPKLGDILVESGVITPTELAIGLVQQADAGDKRPLGEILIDSGSVTEEQIAAALADQKRARSAEPAARATSADSTLRVDVKLLDTIVTLVGELVLTRNQIRQLTAAESADASFVAAAQRLNGVTAELQSHVMKTRMQPIGAVWSKLPRVVRDLAVQCEKRVRVDMHGQDTELDKAIVEAIKDPLTHMVRNAVDHGIELPAERVAAGKPEEGQLLLRAFHEGGHVHIEIQDDGKGIDVSRLKAKAIQKRLITKAQAEEMSDRDAVDLIFSPGFSTAEKVSDLSGRGVGMDVVRTNIESIGGSVECENRPGAGTTFKIQIPLTLAIVPALIATGGGERFAVPHANLLELVGLDANSGHVIESVQGTPVYRLRGRILPIVYLNRELRLESTERSDHGGTIIVLRADGEEFGLVVDHVIGTEEIVVKPLPAHVDAVTVFSGCTVMGDGEVALIIDVRGMAEQSRVLDQAAQHRDTAVDNLGDSAEPAAPVLVVKVSAQTQAAIALDNVERLEVFDRKSVETAAGHRVVQYRGSLLPLIDLPGMVGSGDGDDSNGDVSVIVYSDGRRSVGLVIDSVIDIVEEHVTQYEVPDRFGVSGAAVIKGVVTDVIDVPSLVAAMPATFEELLANASERVTTDA